MAQAAKDGATPELSEPLLAQVLVAVLVRFAGSESHTAFFWAPNEESALEPVKEGFAAGRRSLMLLSACTPLSTAV